MNRVVGAAVCSAMLQIAPLEEQNKPGCRRRVGSNRRYRRAAVTGFGKEKPFAMAGVRH